MSKPVMITGRFLRPDKNVIKRMEAASEQRKEEELTNDIEYSVNTAIFFFYLALIYTFVLCDKAEDAWSETERKSPSVQKMFNDLTSVRNRMQKILNDFLDRCDTDEKQKEIMLILDSLIYHLSTTTESQIDAIFSAISRYYLKGDKEYSSKDKAFKKATFISYLIHTRRLYVMTLKACNVAETKYGAYFHTIQEILQSIEIKKCQFKLDDYYTKLTKKIRNVDLSLDAGCSQAQSNIVKVVCFQGLYKYLTEHKRNFCS